MLPQDDTAQDAFRGPILLNELFQGLAPELRETLASIEKRIHISNNNVVFSSGDRPKFIYVHRKGRALLSHADGTGETVFSCPVESDRVYGLIEALSDNPFVINLSTITPGEFDVIGREDFMNFLREHPDVCFRLVEILSRLYQDAVKSAKSH